MSRRRSTFLEDLLTFASCTVDHNWDPYCFYPPDESFWRRRGAEWLDFVMNRWEAFEQSRAMLADAESQAWFDALMLYRALGYRHVKLPSNTDSYWQEHARAEAAVVETGVSSSWRIPLHRLHIDGITYMGHPGGALSLFGLGQYRLRRDHVTIQPEAGDIVLDLGGCWGDSTLAFAQQVGDGGKVYVFEFVDSNLAIAGANFAANPTLQGRIGIVPHPVGHRSGEIFTYSDRGPATTFGDFGDGSPVRETETLSVDDFVAVSGLPRVDFIKMDVEGAETAALLGAAQTIRAFRPKLAISAYHRYDDLLKLPALIRELSPHYRLYLDHYTLYDHETVLYAI